MDNLKLCHKQIKFLNDYLEPKQKLSLIEQKNEERTYYDLIWTHGEGDYVYETLIFGGDPFEIYIALTGIDFGIGMQKRRR